MKFLVLVALLPLQGFSQSKPTTSLSAKVATIYFENTKSKIAEITRFSLGGADSSYYLLFLQGGNGFYGFRYNGFTFDSREKMKDFITLLVTTEKKYDRTERIDLKSDDGKELSVMWLGKELVVYVNHEVYMRCPKSTLNALNVL